MLTCWLSGTGLARLGWAWGAWRWQMLSYAWPLAVCVIVYGILWGTGMGGFPAPANVTAERAALGWTGAPNWVVVSGWFVLLATVGEIKSVASALGEEIGWRGFLSPVLHERLGFTRGALLTGAIWASWHFPLILGADYDTATPWWFSMPCFVVEVLSISIIMAWIRMRSGSLWTGAVAHASINLFNQAFFAPMTGSRGAITAYAIDESGFVLPVVLACFAVFVWVKQRK